jgi:cyanate lyase
MKDLAQLLKEAEASLDYVLQRLLVDITEELYKAMEDKGWSHHELSEATGKPMLWIKRFFQGNSKMKVADIAIVCHALGVGLDIKTSTEGE